MQKVSLLLSHLPKSVCGADTPLEKLKFAVAFLKTQNIQAITSVGQCHWDCILTALIQNGISVHLIIPKPLTLTDIFAQFSFTPQSYTMVDSREERDWLVCSMADKLFPLWLLKNGHFSKLLTRIPVDKIDWCFDCSRYRFPKLQLKYELPPPSQE
ncbi:MAG: hypothetical protein LBQ50_00035, partial [Planctomycetaceae bacterium]|nr:hypothetical protein [Planctomycetaceae bacterium]